MTGSLVVAMSVVGLAACLAGFTGFGVNLLAVPLLAATIGPREAVVTGLVVSAVISAAVVWTGRRDVDLRLVAGLTAASVPGAFAGAYVFRVLPETGLLLLVAALTVGCAVVVWRPGRVGVVLGTGGGRMPQVATGLVSGVVSSTTGMGGPPVVGYLAVVCRRPAVVRASVSAYALAVGLVSSLLLGLAGGVGLAEFGHSVPVLPAAGVGVVAGMAAFRRWPDHHGHVSAVTLAGVGLMAMVFAVNATWGT